MLIICKSCKKLIDTDKHDFCPKCGSNFNYGDNLKVTNHTADYEEYERRMAEQQRAAVENRMNDTKQATKKETQRRLKNQANQAQGKKNGCSGCAGAIVLLIFGLGVLSGIFEEADFDIDEFLNEEFGTASQTSAYTLPADIYIEIPEYLQNIEEDYIEEEVNYPSHFIIAGETAYTDKYSITCTEVSEYENLLIGAEEGYKYISFKLSLENTTNSERYYYESITCLADGAAAEMTTYAGLFLPGRLDAGECYESSVVFKVPEEAALFDIYYGDDVVIYTSVADIEDYNWTQE